MLIRWKAYGSESDSWEDKENVKARKIVVKKQVRDNVCLFFGCAEFHHGCAEIEDIFSSNPIFLEERDCFYGGNEDHRSSTTTIN